MTFAKIKNGVIEEYPLESFPKTAFAPNQDYPKLGIFWVHPTSPVKPDAVEGLPSFNEERNRWEQTWRYPSPPNWTAFNAALLNDSDWLVVAELLPTDLRYGIVSTAANGNSEGLTAAYGLAVSYLDSQGQSLSQTIKDSWQAIADANHIPVTF